MGNIGSSGSSHYCCCCCYCCLDEGEKVGLVLKRFTPMSCVHAIDDNLMLLVGRVVLAAQPFYAPASGMVRSSDESVPICCLLLSSVLHDFRFSCIDVEIFFPLSAFI